MRILKRPLDWQERSHQCIVHAWTLSKTELETLNSSELPLRENKEVFCFFFVFGETSQYEIGGGVEKEKDRNYVLKMVLSVYETQRKK